MLPQCKGDGQYDLYPLIRHKVSSPSLITIFTLNTKMMLWFEIVSRNFYVMVCLKLLCKYFCIVYIDSVIYMTPGILFLGSGKLQQARKGNMNLVWYHYGSKSG